MPEHSFRYSQKLQEKDSARLRKEAEEEKAAYAARREVVKNRNFQL